MKFEEKVKESLIKSDIMDIIAAKKALDIKINRLTKDLELFKDTELPKENIESVVASFEFSNYSHPDDLYDDIINELDLAAEEMER